MALAASAAACAESRGGGSATSSDASDDTAGTSLASLVDRVPAGDAFEPLVVYTSLERIRRAAGLEPARTSEDEGEQLTEIVGLSGLVLAGPFQRAALDPELEDEIGFDVTRLDATLSAGSAPDDLAILAGRLDTDDIDEALTSYELWADAVEVGA